MRYIVSGSRRHAAMPARAAARENTEIRLEVNKETTILHQGAVVYRMDCVRMMLI